MKRVLLVLMLFGIACIVACQSKSSQVQSFIDGTYVNHAAGELSVADDTLVVTHTDGLHYVLSRRTGYYAIRLGKPLPKRFLHVRLEGVYDPAGLVLNETTTGRVFRFDPDKHLLLLKQAIYRKL